MTGAHPPFRSLAGQGTTALGFAPLFDPVPDANTPHYSPNGHGVLFYLEKVQSLAGPVSDSRTVGSNRLRLKARADLVCFLQFQRLTEQPASIGFRAAGLNDLQVLTQGANAKQPAAAHN